MGTINLLGANLSGASFHSINVPSEWERGAVIFYGTRFMPVSIQLMSPASGNSISGAKLNYTNMNSCFHSINVPSEWEQGGGSIDD